MVLAQSENPPSVAFPGGFPATIQALAITIR